MVNTLISEQFKIFLFIPVCFIDTSLHPQIENLDRAFETVKQKLFGRLHDILRKQIVERVPMQGVPTRARESNSNNYFLADAEKITTLSSFASPAQEESRADEMSSLSS